MTPSSKGFTACGIHYVMGENEIPLMEQLKVLLKEIRKNALDNKIKTNETKQPRRKAT